MKNDRCQSDNSKQPSRGEIPASSRGGAPAAAVLLPVAQARPAAVEISQADGCRDDGAATALSREAANLLELLSRHSMSDTPLSISSKAAQAVLRQF